MAPVTDHEGKRRVCLLTGASGRLGRAFCAKFAGQYDIAAVYHTAPPPFGSQEQSVLDPLMPSAALAENVQRIFTIRADLEQPEQAVHVVRQTLERFGCVDLLINAATFSVWSPLLEDPGLSKSAERQLRLNVIVPLRLCEILARQFWCNKTADNLRHNRNVVNISSTAGVYVFEDLGQSIYSASKAALNYLSYHLASEFWDIGVRVNALAPDAFPSNVSIDAVLSTIERIDRSTTTGQVIILDAFGQRELRVI